MSLDRSGRFQKAVLWAASGYNNDGEHNRVAAVEIMVRWEETNKEIINENGNPIGIDVTVWANQDIAVHSIMWLGALTSFVDGTSTDLMEVVSFANTPDLKNRSHARQYFLARRSDKLPTLDT
ncbi:hypothetical protein M0R72_16270 [Candidatus Pacearchaeota archaeon]|jgi:hypothetical protein|nr:hypothetical protein [Candidatus Pacearchaeota archaeon]